ncbi:hypothetical protein BGZ74_000778 [Mortierella antarctica]|nr:hypothetical protein BGZ74_000778 [Mortierella antarctica]
MAKSKMTWHKWSLCVWAIVFSTICLKTASGACSPCDLVEGLFKPCNTSLAILTWPSEAVYQPNEVQAPCACNDNFHDLIDRCLKCESSTTAKYSVKEKTGYQLVCTSFHQTWKAINIPQSSTTASTTTSTTSGILPSDSATSGEDTGNPLSSGALAGIIVSAVALVVALSVAAYVYRRRRRERALEKDDYKYSDTHRDSYMEVALPQYNNGMQPTLPPISKVSNLRVTNPDSDDEAPSNPPQMSQHQATPSFEVNRGSPGWRRGSFDDD